MSYKYILTHYDDVADEMFIDTFKSKDEVLWYLCWIHQYGLEVIRPNAKV